MTGITYKTFNQFKQQADANNVDAEFWLVTRLRGGGIEDQIKKLRDLMAVVGTAFIRDHPHKISAVAEAIDQDGFDFKVDES